MLLQLPHFGNRPSDVERFIKLSLEKLGLDYLDMYLIHLPFAFKLDEETCAAATNADGSYILDFGNDHVSVWKVRNRADCAIQDTTLARYERKITD